MKIEDLNKTQVVMLTLLTSFVTSIATGIVTVSLMEEAPQTLPQTINRVIERTVEKVTPAIEGKPTVVTKETTVVVKEEDLITKSISEVGGAMVSVMLKKINGEGLVENIFLGWGFVANEAGKVLTDSTLVSSEGSYSLKTSNGVIFDVKVISQDEKLGVAVLQTIIDKTSKLQSEYVFTPIKIAKSSTLKLGQTAIVVGGKNKLSVAVGTITSIEDDSVLNASSTVNVLPKSIEASVGAPQSTKGALLINSFGEIAGVYLSANSLAIDTFVPIERVLQGI